MTLEETKKLLMMIEAAFPNFKVENPKETANTWHWLLTEYPANVILGSFQIYVKTNKTGFAPSVSQLINGVHEPTQIERQTEGEAWALVKKAMSDSNYHAEDRFNELPEAVQRAVGSPSMLRQWAQTDSDEVNTVVMSNFQRTYRAILNKQEYNDKVPEEISQLVKGLSEKVAGRIEVKE